jgi:hypothetical protein
MIFFSYISWHICSDSEYLGLLEFVRFEYLSAKCVSYFLSALPDAIDHHLWNSISRQLISRIPREVEFPLKETGSLDGLIACLTRKHGEMFTTTELSRISAQSGSEVCGLAGISTKCLPSQVAG